MIKKVATLIWLMLPSNVRGGRGLIGRILIASRIEHKTDRYRVRKTV